MRLNKYIALCGVTSRRGADKLIAQGKVSLNGSVVQTMGPDIDIEKDTVCVNGIAITPKKEKIYIMLNKPAGYVCSCADERGRKTVVDLVEGINERIYPVGRLDIDTEGLLILTNDGDFAFKCTHPKHEVNKQYFAVIEGSFDENAARQLCSGLTIDSGKTSAAEIEIIEIKGNQTKLYITIHEGRNRQVKKMFDQVGCRVEYLKRVCIGGLRLEDLAVGKWRRLNDEDFDLLGVNF